MLTVYHGSTYRVEQPLAADQILISEWAFILLI